MITHSVTSSVQVKHTTTTIHAVDTSSPVSNPVVKVTVGKFSTSVDRSIATSVTTTQDGKWINVTITAARQIDFFNS